MLKRTDDNAFPFVAVVGTDMEGASRRPVCASSNHTLRVGLADSIDELRFDGPVGEQILELAEIAEALPLCWGD